MATIKIKNPEYVEGGESDKWIPITMLTQSNIDLSNYYTKEEVNALIGDINTVLDEINGEEL